MDTLKQNSLIVYFILSMTVLVAGCPGGCVTAQRIDPSTSAGYGGFIRDGATTRQEIEDRLGPATLVTVRTAGQRSRQNRFLTWNRAIEHTSKNGC